MEEVADLTVFLGSDEAKFMNGVVVPIDGGFTIQ
ncbi:SDR family oxidoreductase [Staphylococcus sp. Mo2-7]